MKTHTRPWKEAQLKELTELVKKYPVIAVADLASFPADLFASLRKQLHGKAEIRVSKTRLVRRALEAGGYKETGLNEKVVGSCALVCTSLNPFELYSFIKKNKGNAPAKEGAIAPDDIIIPAGDTGLPPGPALSDLKGAGLKVKVEGPSIHVTEDKVVTKKGEPVNAAVAGTLAKLDIKPIKIGLTLTGVMEEKQFFLPDVLDIDEEEVFNNFVSAHRNAFLLSLEVGYFNSETVPLLIGKAARESKALALEANILTKETVGNVLAKADAQAKALKAKVPEAPVEEKKEEKPEEKPAEEAKQEAKPEEKPEEEKAGEKPAEEKKEEEKKE